MARSGDRPEFLVNNLLATLFLFRFILCNATYLGLEKFIIGLLGDEFTAANLSADDIVIAIQNDNRRYTAKTPAINDRVVPGEPIPLA